MAITIAMPMISARGIDRAGSLTSPATMFICCQPPIVKSTGTNAAPSPTISGMRGTGAPNIGGGGAICPQSTRPPTISAPIAATLATVITFCTTAPGFTPR